MRYTWILLIISLFVLEGCGGGGDSSSPSRPSGPGEEEMQVDKTYTVFPGDRIEKLTPNAEVSITHVAGHEESDVRLVAGEAKIIRP